MSTRITGASKLSQLQEHLGAVDVLPKLTYEIMARIDAISAQLTG